MTVLREEEIESFIKRRSAEMNGLLIHGADSSAVASLSQQVLRGIVGQGDQSFATSRYEVSALKENPGLLDDEFKSMSLLGERRVLIIDGADESCLKSLAPILASSKTGNFVMLLADALSKSSKLRAACEEASLFGALAIYEEDEAALAARIRKLLVTENLRWGDEAEAVFFELVGSDRSTAVQEAKKLVLYCFGSESIAETDVLAICGDTAGFGADQLIDAVLDGDMETADRMSASLDADSAGTRGILSVLMFHLTKLQDLRLDMERGSNADMAVRNAKPPIFFKRRSNIIKQLRKFDLADLILMQQAVADAMFQTRKLPDLFEAVTNRTLLSLARTARTKLQ
jgi:DNA polymerase III subunit delta